ncbi:MAG: hypothetical protein H6822_36155 [Planctomycetaceae bacterium]|nr:hypothetical protein [Planctomycetales bacterium]MCB9927623.1 hypothetical protein [Planctomycetaceae bacterium]
MNLRRSDIRCLLLAAVVLSNAAATDLRAQWQLPTTAPSAQATLARQALNLQPEVFEPAPNAFASPSPSDFPALPPDPYAAERDPLPPLEEELWHHGGSYLYAPEGDHLNWPPPGADEHFDHLRLPEDWIAPQPWTAYSEFLGADPIFPRGKWFGDNAYTWDPRFVGYGGYSLFAFAFEENNLRQDVIGHQLRIDLDMQLTGTERFHIQMRPLGERNTGGSYYQFSNPDGYVDNSTAEPQRYWFEGELHSIFGAYLDPFAVTDYNFVVGKFPFALHNFLLMNDEILGVVLAKNTIYLGPLSNLNVQLIYGANDVDAYPNADGTLYGVHAQADHRGNFYEATYAYVAHDFDASRDSHFTALSGTTFLGPFSLTGRALLKYGDQGGLGSGQLFTVESNRGQYLHQNAFGIDERVYYCNAFYKTAGWNPISGGNLNRLRTAFETNPLVRISVGSLPVRNLGIALGVQLFRHHQDESLIPEIAFESPDGIAVAGFGLRYLRKTGSRSAFEVLATFTLSDDPRFDREGVFTSYNIDF